ncbi:hypothetical protein [Sphingomonas sp.]|uniref:hypothetical protein n=1 Tax=Sphingomonas sp. TaxID=28214 RepID=UPI003B3A930C
MDIVRAARLTVTAALLTAAPGVCATSARPEAGTGWVYIATTHAQHMNDHDTLLVAGPNSRFTALQLRVTDAPLHMKRMMVTYDNRDAENVLINADIPKNGVRAIHLPRSKRAVRKIEYWYDTKGWLRGTADVAVYGRR